MDFQQKMIEYAKYGISVRTSSNEGVDYYMVSLTFGNKWKVQQPEGQQVMCAKVSNEGTYCYMTQVSNGINPIFGLIDETIRYNEELEKKVELLKVKAEEMKELFATRSYEELLFLKFVIETPQETSAQKKGRQLKSGKKTPQKPNTEPTEAILEEQTEPDYKQVQETVPQATCNEPSDIDRKIAAAIGNNV